MVRLGIRQKEDFPVFEEWFVIHDEKGFEVPMPITQFLWGYEWEAYELHLTSEGKAYYHFEEDENPENIRRPLLLPLRTG